jgi:hypothetical protein
MCIVDNVLLTHESWTWAKQNNHEVICMKLDLAKAYDAMAWEFMFQAIITIGIHLTFKKQIWYSKCFKIQ